MPATVTLEHYEVLTHPDGSLHELGRGAMGITYKGIDTRLGLPVALKVINATHLNSESARQRFVREARAAAGLRHRNVASVFHLGEEDGNYFYAMEFIDGETLESLVKRQGPLPPVLALRLTAQVARALNAAQAQELVHRDIKPANLMAVQEDDDLIVKVIDFGLAKMSYGGETADAALTKGGFIGTPHFASPEQLEERDIDVRSDIYSLGITLWYLLRAGTPFSGSVARVMGQHLTKPPPFEELEGIPPTVVDLLRKMLAKDPAERQQTPADLRREIEQCLRSLNPRAPARARSRPDSSTAPASRDSTTAADDGRFETGVTIVQRYLLTHDLGENEAGDNFRARDLQAERDVRLLALHPELLADPDIAAHIERDSPTLSSLANPHVLEVLEFAKAGGTTFLTLGWTHGFTLRELLRTRRELTREEVQPLLAGAAAGLDYTLGANVARLEVGLHHVLIHFPGQETPPESWLARPLKEWPEFIVKINPLAIWRDLFAMNWAAGQTLVGGVGQRERYSAPGIAGAVHALATVAYELLGGVAATAGAYGYTPLAALDEAGNAVLERALFQPGSFVSAAEFAGQFSEPPPVDTASASRSRAIEPTSPEPPPEPDIAAATIVQEDHPTLASEFIEPAPPEPKRSAAPLIGVSLLAAVVISGAIYFLSRPKPELVLQPTPAPQTTPAARPQATPQATPRFATAPTPIIAPLPTARPVTPAPPTPPTTHQQLATNARHNAELLEARQASREALGAWLQMARDFPEFDTGRLGIELLLNRLRSRPGGLTAKEFAAMRPDITGAAHLGVSAAMMVLGEELRTSEPEQSFAWYCTAAQGGDPLAMTLAGLMLASGSGTPPSAEKAVAYFSAAAEKKEPNGMTALADCYLNGEGIAKDEKQAVALLQQAADKGNARAKNLLGRCYHKGLGIPRDEPQAFRLFSEAAERGHVEALTNLGALYMKGEGTAKNEAKGFEKFREAAGKGDANAMYYLAGCYDSSLGTKSSPSAAKSWFQKAAEAGHAGAIEWCKSNNIPFKATR
jgi:serine/threonine protein kinase/TPR repeat protein